MVSNSLFLFPQGEETEEGIQVRGIPNVYFILVVGAMFADMAMDPDPLRLTCLTKLQPIDGFRFLFLFFIFLEPSKACTLGSRPTCS